MKFKQGDLLTWDDENIVFLVIEAFEATNLRPIIKVLESDYLTVQSYYADIQEWKLIQSQNME